MRISDWSSDVCSSDLSRNAARQFAPCQPILAMDDCQALAAETVGVKFGNIAHRHQHKASLSLADATGLKTRPQALSADTQLVRSPGGPTAQPLREQAWTTVRIGDFERRKRCSRDRKSTRLNSSH